MNTRVKIFERVWKPSWNITKNDWKKVTVFFAQPTEYIRKGDYGRMDLKAKSRDYM